MNEPQKTFKFVVIDDDPIFLKIISNYGKVRGITLDCFPSLMEMGSIGRLSNYDLAIVDYDLGQINGIEIAEYLPIFFGNMPLVLISATDRASARPWPGSIKCFVNKDQGPDAILTAAQDAAIKFAKNAAEPNQIRA